MKVIHIFILVYKDNQKLKGFVIINIYGKNRENCFIRNLGVSSSHRGQGIGKKLLLSGLNIAKEYGVKKSMLWVGIENKIARNLYEKVGYNLNKNEAEVVFQVQFGEINEEDMEVIDNAVQKTKDRISNGG